MYDLFEKLKSLSAKPTVTGTPEYLVVGLGNPEPKYDTTRHNAGFMAIDHIAAKAGCKVNQLKFKSLCGLCELEGKKVMLLKPTTYMNSSGEAVREASQFYKIPPEKIIVIFDDVSLDVGKMAHPSQGQRRRTQRNQEHHLSDRQRPVPAHQGGGRQKAAPRLRPCRLGAGALLRRGPEGAAAGVRPLLRRGARDAQGQYRPGDEPV